MQFILKEFSTPAANLAFEEWLFKSFETPTLRLWRNPTSVVVGKHQNALSQADVLACESLKIPVLRRISGGGTVFHDMGNVNFSFFRFVDPDNPIDYHQNLEIISKSLARIGFNVTENERHDLYCGDFKVSGNAQHHSKNKVLHHGTLLYDTDTTVLKQVIHHPEGKYIDKAVKSKRSPVINLRKVNDIGTADAFYSRLADSLSQRFPITKISDPLPEELLEKYTDPDWNLGYGPKYTLCSKWGDSTLEIEVQRGGIIEAVRSTDESLDTSLQVLVGCAHRPAEARAALPSEMANNGELIKCLF